ncbi:MAG: polymer-forming cytoskeletal protein [Porticoccaceae bacterium]|nr:polymer-forming cytoskeletal protein [Porticoccaceae bacterium]
MFEKNKNSVDNGREGNQAAAGGSRPAVIGPSVKIIGQISCAEDLLVEGSVEGSISSELHEVLIGVTGTLKADVRAHVVMVEGTVRGDITGLEKVVVCKTGNVLGNIDSPRVTLEDGAKFKGSIEMDPDVPAATLMAAKAFKSVPLPKEDVKAE